MSQKIIPNLWFDHQAETAVNFYVSVFKDAKIGRTSYYTKEGFEFHHIPEGTVLTIEFELAGQKFMVLNGGPIFKFNEAISFVVDCKDQEEIDYYWERLSAGGDEKAKQCGWLKDQFGVSWQIVPNKMADWMSDPDTEKVQRVMKVMFQMKKLIIADLEKAYNGD